MNENPNLIPGRVLPGDVFWSKKLSYGGRLGGMANGIATDGKRVYVSASNSRNFGTSKFYALFSGDPSGSVGFERIPWVLLNQEKVPQEVKDSIKLDDSNRRLNYIFPISSLNPSDKERYRSMWASVGATDVKDTDIAVYGGVWTAIDIASGNVVWQRPDPDASLNNSSVTIANGVMFVGSKNIGSINFNGSEPDLFTPINGFAGPIAGSLPQTSETRPQGKMWALNADTGEILWSHNSLGSVGQRPAIVNGSVYWGSGYLPNWGADVYDYNRLFAFKLCPHGTHSNADNTECIKKVESTDHAD